MSCIVIFARTKRDRSRNAFNVLSGNPLVRSLNSDRVSDGYVKDGFATLDAPGGTQLPNSFTSDDSSVS
jgi:hypothetical protein